MLYVDCSVSGSGLVGLLCLTIKQPQVSLHTLACWLGYSYQVVNCYVHQRTDHWTPASLGSDYNRYVKHWRMLMIIHPKPIPIRTAANNLTQFIIPPYQ